MIQHVSLETRREDGPAAQEFWELLGFEPVEPPETLSDRASWLERGGTQIHLLWHDSPNPQPEGHVAVVVDDWDGTLERLRRAGHEFEPRAEHWGVPRGYATSPGGHRVELMAAPPS